MKLLKNKFDSKLFMASILLMIRLPVFGITSDVKKSIFINADTQFLNVKDDIIIFIGNVILTQGTIKIYADKIIIYPVNNKNRQETIYAYGNPSIFYQLQDNGKLLQGHALKIRYKIFKNYLTLTSDAYLKQLNDSITGYQINLLIKEGKIEAYGKNNQQVTTILIPSKLKK